MKFTVNLGTTQQLHDAIFEAVFESLSKQGMPKDERAKLFQQKTVAAWTALKKWVCYEEYVAIEFDTDSGIATILESREKPRTKCKTRK